MANKNDLRFIKTEKLIRETYLTLKKKQSASVKVTELCNAALINKTTFYAHYETMESLHNSICKETVKNLLDDCEVADQAFEKMEDFVCALVTAILAEEDTLNALYRNNTSGMLKDFEEELLKIYLQDEEDPDRRNKITFCIGGASRLLFMSRNPESIHTAVQLMEKVFDLS